MTAWNPGYDCERPWGALVLSCSFLTYMMNGGCFFSNGIFQTEFSRLFDSRTSWLTSIQFGLCQCSGIFSGTLVELYGCRVVGLVGCFMISAGYILSAFVQDIRLMYFTYSVLPGLGLGLQYVPCLVSVQYYFERRRTLATGIMSVGSGTGIFIFSMLSRLLLNIYGLQSTMFLFGGLVLHTVPLVLVMTSHPRTRRKAGSGLAPATQKSNSIANNGNRIRSGSKYSTNDDAIHNDSLRKSSLLQTDSKNTAVASSDSRLYDVQRKDPLSGTGVEFHKTVNIECTTSNRTLTGSIMSSQGQLSLHRSMILRRKMTSTSESTHQMPTFDIELEEVQPEKVSLLREMKRLLWTIALGLAELRNPPFLVLFLSVFLNALGVQAQYIFLPAKTLDMGATKWQAAMLISITGISDTVGRLLSGWLGNLIEKHMIFVFAAGILFCGIGSTGAALQTSYGFYVASSVCFGLGIGNFNTMYCPMVVQELGVAKVARSVGILGLAYGMALLVSPELGGALFKLTGNINVHFYMSAVCQYTAVLLLMIYRFLPCCYKHHSDELEEIGSIGDVTVAASREIPRLTLSSDPPISSSLSLGISRDILYINNHQKPLNNTGVVVLPSIYGSVVSIHTLKSTPGLCNHA